MTIQIQKEEFVIAGDTALDLSAFAWALSVAPAGEPVRAAYVRWGRHQARRQVSALGAALAEVSERVAREPVREATSLEARRRARLDRSRIVAEVRAEAERDLTTADREALAKADALDAEAGAIGTRDRAGRLRRTAEQRAQAGRLQGQAQALRHGVEARRAQTAGLGLDQRRMGALIELEAAREGEAEVIEKRRGQKGVRIRTRDGLKLAHERGTFGKRQTEADRLLAVGLRYRDRYEAAQASVKSCLDVADGVRVARTIWIEAGAAQRRAARANLVRRLDVAVVTTLGPEALDVLRKVAGEARTVRSLASGARRRETLGRLLVGALGVVADVLERGG